ncbi:MAG TPA: DUF2303 family protein [Acidimicrobiia bacterium]
MEGTDNELEAAVGGPIMMQMEASAAERITEVADKRPVAILKEGLRLEDLEKFQDTPRRIRDRVTMLSLESLSRYIARHREPSTTVFVNAEVQRVDAVIDYHEASCNEPGSSADCARWADFRASYAFPQTPDWKAWIGHNGKWLAQSDFAEFLEEHAHNISIPTPANMLEIARTLTGTRKVNWKSAVHEASGDVQIAYEPQSDTRAGKSGSVEIPERFELTIQPFQGSAPYAIDVLFRYRIEEGGGLMLSYRLMRVDKVIDDAFREEVEKFTASLPEGVFVVEGVA